MTGTLHVCAGGKIIVSPSFDAEVVTETKARGLASWPGVLSPSECFAALKADYVANGPGRSNLRYGYVTRPA